MTSWQDRPHTLFLCFALLFGALFLIATPPMRAPNEITHFSRVLGLAQGRLLTPTRVSRPIKAFLDNQREKMSDRLSDREHPHYYHYMEILEWLEVNPNPRGETIKLGRDRALMYSPLPYFPAVPPVWLASHAGWSPYALLYLTRFSLMLAATGLIYAAIRITPVLKWQMFLIGLFPNVVFIRSCVTADSLTIGYAFLFIALVLKTRADGAATRRHVQWMALLSFCICLSKSAYFMMPLLFLLLPPRLFASSRERRNAALAVIALPLLCGIVWLWMVPTNVYIHNIPFTNEYQQMAYILAHPWEFAQTLWSSWATHFKRYIADLVSVLGLWEVALPRPISVLAYAALFALPLCAPQASTGFTLPASGRALCVAIFILTLLVVSAMLYVCDTPVGLHDIPRIQGRYFTPVLPLLALAASYRTQRLSWYEWCGAVAIVFTLLFLTASLILYLQMMYNAFGADLPLRTT